MTWTAAIMPDDALPPDSLVGRMLNPEPRPEVPDCPTCGGAGTIDERLGGYAFSNSAATCPDCDGTGEGYAPPTPVDPLPLCLLTEQARIAREGK